MTDHPIDEDDITALRREGDLKTYMRGLINTAPPRPADSKPAPKKRGRQPPYHITQPGAWPCGTAASGPTPPPCGNCPPSHDARVQAWTTYTKATENQQTGDDE